MNGELLAVWPSTWSEIWAPLRRAAFAPEDLFIELTRQLVPAPVAPASPPVPPAEAFDERGELADPGVLAERDAYEQARQDFDHQRIEHENALSGLSTRAYFKGALADVDTEAAAVGFLEKVFEALETFDQSAELQDRYRHLVDQFIAKYSLRYALGESFSLRATIPGLFAKMLSEVRRISQADEHLLELLNEFEGAFSDLRIDRTPARMKTCLQKQYNFLEGLGATCDGVNADTLGAICDQLDWPHSAIKEVGKKLYGFGSSYPGLRHAGQRKAAIRPLNMKDFVSISLMLASFTPYVLDQLEPETCYAC